MEEVYHYLKALEVNFLATRNANAVSCRPFGEPVKFDHKIYILTHAEKDVAQQLAANNQICIVAYNPEKDDWLRIFCEAVDDSDNSAAKQAIIDEFDWAEEAGYTLDNPSFKCYYLAHAKAEIRDCDGKVLASYEF